MKFNYNDGGREVAGYKGKTGDCVVRAIAIATDKSCQEVYDTLFELNEEYSLECMDRCGCLFECAIFTRCVLPQQNMGARKDF